MGERRSAVPRSIAIGFSAGLFALAVFYAQPGCDDGAAVESKPEAESKSKPAAESKAKAEVPADVVAKPAPKVVEPEAESAQQVVEPKAESVKAQKTKSKKTNDKNAPNKKVFIPSSKSGLFVNPNLLGT